MSHATAFDPETFEKPSEESIAEANERLAEIGIAPKKLAITEAPAKPKAPRKPRTTDRKSLTISPAKDIIEAIEKAAEDDERPVSTWLERKIRLLHERGWLATDELPPAKL